MIKQQELADEVLTRLDSLAASLQVGVEQLVSVYSLRYVAEGIGNIVWGAVLLAMATIMFVVSRRFLAEARGIVDKGDTVTVIKSAMLPEERRPLQLTDLGQTAISGVAGVLSICLLLGAVGLAVAGIQWIFAPEAYAIKELMEIALDA